MRLIPSLCCLMLLLTSASVARAQDAANIEIARKHYELGEKLYQTAAYAAALAEFKKAHKLSPRPALLFNIARTLEMMGQLTEAIEVYQRYLKESPDAPNRSMVETRILNLQSRDKMEPSTPKPRRETPTSAPVKPQPAPLRAEPPPLRWKRTAGWVTLSVGGAALITGVVMGALAKGKAKDYDELMQKKQPYAEIQSQLTDIKDSGEGLETGQIVCLVLGGVAVAAGGGLILWDFLTPERPSAVSLTPILSPRMAGLSGEVRF